MANEGGNINQFVEQLIQNLAVMRNTRSVYGQDHKITKRTMDILYASVETALNLRPEIAIGFIKKEIVFDKLPLYTLSGSLKKFILDITENGIERIVIKSGITREEMVGFIEVLILKKGEVFEKGGYKHALSSYGVKNITISKIAIKKEEEVDINVLASDTLNKTIKAMQELLIGMKKEHVINAERPRGTVLDIVKLIIRNKSALPLFINLRKRDNPIVLHSINVMALTLIQAISLSVEKEFYSELGESALLHEIEELARQTGVLVENKDAANETQDTHEAQAQDNSIQVAKMLLKARNVSKLSPVVAFECIKHSSVDASKRSELNPATSLISLACYYDSLIVKALKLEVSYEDVYQDIMKLSDKGYKPELLENFFVHIGVYPPGSIVELDTKEIGIVVRANNEIRRPTIEVFSDESKTRMDQTKIVDLSEIDPETNDFRCNIAKTLKLSDVTGIIPDKYT